MVVLFDMIILYCCQLYCNVEVGDVGVSRSILMNNWTSVTSTYWLPWLRWVGGHLFREAGAGKGFVHGESSGVEP